MIKKYENTPIYFAQKYRGKEEESYNLAVAIFQQLFEIQGYKRVFVPILNTHNYNKDRNQSYPEPNYVELDLAYCEGWLKYDSKVSCGN